MGHIISLAAGAILVGTGFLMFFVWGYEFLFLIRGVLPILMISAGSLALAAGIAEYKDRKKQG